MNKTQKIAIYGGAFDPPHSGHCFAIWLLRESGLFDQIWVVPSGDRYDKEQLIPVNHRIAMLQIIFEKNFKNCLDVNLYLKQALNQELPQTTYDFIKYLELQYSNYSFSLCIGAELLPELVNWKSSAKLIEEVDIVVIQRDSLKPDQRALNFRYIASPYGLNWNISSTLIREMISKQVQLEGLIDPQIQEYINKYKLYLNQ